MKVDNKQDVLRKNAKRASMRVRCGGVEHLDADGSAAGGDVKPVKNKKESDDNNKTGTGKK